ncbi:MAG: glycosyltransferase family 4 protein [bacterium]|nr:glycosyltransferase family 4 protein [bacterium]
MLIGVDARPANEHKRAGVGNYCCELLRAFPRVLGEHRLRIYLDREPVEGFPLDEDDAEFRILPPCRLWTQRALARDLRWDPPDVFFSTGLQMPLATRCPRVVTVLDLAYFEFGSYFPWRFRMTARTYTRLAVRLARHFVSISEATKRDLVNRFRLADDRVSVTPLAVSDAYQPCSDPARVSAVRETYGLPEKYLLCVGRLQPRKNIGRLIQAYEQLKQRCPELPHELVIAGDQGWLFDSIFKTAEASAVGDSIRFLGFVDGPDLPVLIGEADGLALVSLWEGFGLPVLEAMACGTAVVTSNCSSLPEVAGDAAVLVDPYDVDAIAAGLERVLTDDASRDMMERAGQTRAREFTWERTARLVLGALTEAVS